MIPVSYTVKQEKAEKTLRKVKQVAESPRRAMLAISQALERYVRNTFATQTDPWGNPWAEWKHPAEMFAARTRKGEPSVQKLIDTYKMFDGIERSSDENTATVSAGNNESSEYVLAQQFGTDHITARPFFPMRNENEAAFPDDWLRIVFEPIETELSGAAQ